MSFDPQDPNAVIPWYRAAVVRRLALALVALLLSVTHLSKYVTAQALAPAIDDLLEVAGMAYAAWALHARVTRVSPPVAISQKKADIANGNFPPQPKDAPT